MPQGIGSGWSALGGALAGPTPGVYEEQLYKGYLANRAKYDAGYAMERERAAREQRIARSGLRETLEPLGFAEQAPFFQAYDNPDQVMNAITGMRGYNKRDMQSAAALAGLPEVAQGHAWWHANGPQKTADIKGDMLFNPLGGADQTVNPTPMAYSKDRLNQAKTYSAYETGHLAKEKRSHGGFAPGSANELKAIEDRMILQGRAAVAAGADPKEVSAEAARLGQPRVAAAIWRPSSSDNMAGALDLYADPNVEGTPDPDATGEAAAAASTPRTNYFGDPTASPGGFDYPVPPVDGGAQPLAIISGGQGKVRTKADVLEQIRPVTSDAEVAQLLAEADYALEKKVPREQVIERLRAYGIVLPDEPAAPPPKKTAAPKPGTKVKMTKQQLYAPNKK